MKVPSLAWWPIVFLAGGALCDGALGWLAAGPGNSRGHLAVIAAAVVSVTLTVVSGLRAVFRSGAERAAWGEFTGLLGSLGAGWFVTEDGSALVQVGCRGRWPFRQAYLTMFARAEFERVMRDGSGAFAGESYTVLNNDVRVHHRNDGAGAQWKRPILTSQMPCQPPLRALTAGAVLRRPDPVGKTFSAKPAEVRDLVAQLRAVRRVESSLGCRATRPARQGG